MTTPPVAPPSAHYPPPTFYAPAAPARPSRALGWGALGGAVVFPLAGLVLGILAIVWNRGRGLGITAVVLSVLWPVLFVGLVFAFGPALQDAFDTSESVRAEGRGDLPVAALRAGDCLAGLAPALDGARPTVPLVPCSEPHQAEVYAVLPAEGAWPGEAKADARGVRGCNDALPADTAPGTAYRYLVPSQAGWGDTPTICVRPVG